MRRTLVLSAVLLLVGCQNWDLKRPAQETTGAGGFTRLGEDPTRLTNDVAIRRLDEIGSAQGQDRLTLIEQFLADFPQARFIPAVHRLSGEAQLTEGRPEAAAEDFERALVLTRTDVLGMPLETDIPYQLAMARLSAGDSEGGLSWLVRTSIVDDSPRIDQALRWAWGEVGSPGVFSGWLSDLREPLLVRAPSFSLPGLLEPQLDLESSLGKATIINFWSPT